MGAGTASVSTSQKREPSGSFPAGAANNGLSVDPVSGKIVLGNDAPGNNGTAQFLSDREIDTQGSYLRFIDDTQAGVYVQINASAIRVFDLTLSNFCIINSSVIQLSDAATNTVNVQPASVAIGDSALNRVAFNATQISLVNNGIGAGVQLANPGLDVLTINGNVNDLIASFDTAQKIVSLGDISNLGDGTKLVIDDTADTVVVTADGGFVATDSGGATVVLLSGTISLNNGTNSVNLSADTGNVFTINAGGTTLVKSTTTLSNAAGAALGTLSNAPVAGNPTKWISINDNGTIRRIPTW
jgi:hypothetical protein